MSAKTRIIQNIFLFLTILAPISTVFGQAKTPLLPLPSCEQGIPLFFWDARTSFDFRNFGDDLSEKIVERMLGHRICTTLNRTYGADTGRIKLLAVGSLLHLVEDGDVVWGTGIKHTDKKMYQFTKLDVRAVRGPLTRLVILAMGLDCPEVYGDPVLLVPMLFPEFQKPSSPANEYIIISHFHDEHFFQGMPNVVSTKEDWDKIIEKVLNSKFVISSALHGIVIAEAFGIPARYLRVGDSETIVKYADYYYGTKRYNFKIATSIDEALQMGGEPPPDVDLDKLYQAFPFDYFQSNTL